MSKEWISGKDLLEAPWNLKDFELLDCVLKKGLQPYNLAFQRIPPPIDLEYLLASYPALRLLDFSKDDKPEDLDTHWLTSNGHFIPKDIERSYHELLTKTNTSIDEIEINKIYFWQDYRPHSEGQIKKAIDIVVNAVYKTADVKELRKKTGFGSYETDSLPAVLLPETNGKKEHHKQEQEVSLKEQEHPKEVIDLLRKAKNEIEDLYKGMMANRQEPDEENGETYGDSLKYAAEEWFDKAGNEYKIITKKHVTDFHLYISNSKQEVPDIGHIPRDFKGKLCQVLISDAFPNKYLSDLNRPSKGFGIKALYKLLNDL